MEVLRRTPWSRIREQNSVYQESMEIVGTGKPTGSVWKETIAVSATISISVEMSHHQIRLRILSCSRMSAKHREPEVPEESPSGRMSRWPCKDYLKRTCNNSFLKSGTLQNACSTRPRVVVGLGKSAHSHIVRLMNSRQKGLKRMMIKVQWLCWRKVIFKKEDLLPTNVTIDRGNLIRWVIRSWDKNHLNVDHLMHGNWVAHFKTWRRRSLFSGSAQTCGNQSNVWNPQKAIARHTKIRDTNPSLGYIVIGNLASVAPTLQNLRIGLRRRQSGKSKVPAKQRGSWPKVYLNLRSIKE